MEKKKFVSDAVESYFYDDSHYLKDKTRAIFAPIAANESFYSFHKNKNNGALVPSQAQSHAPTFSNCTFNMSAPQSQQFQPYNNNHHSSMFPFLNDFTKQMLHMQALHMQQTNTFIGMLSNKNNINNTETSTNNNYQINLTQIKQNEEERLENKEN